MLASVLHRAVLLSAVGLGVVALSAIQARTALANCADLPSQAELQMTLEGVVDGLHGPNAGLGNEMWGTIVDRDGVVCAVAFTGDFLGDQWPGSRVISAQKANTANAFSLPAGVGFGAPLSSGNLYGTVLEQGSLYGLQFSRTILAAAPRTTGSRTIPWSASLSAASMCSAAGSRYTIRTALCSVGSG